MIALHTGPVVVCPPVPEIEQLLQGCGEIVAVEREQDLIVLSCASATMSTFLAFQNSVIDWSIGEGLDPQTAKEYVAALFAGLATETLHTNHTRLARMPEEHETPGGLNEYVRQSLTTAGMFAALADSLAHLYTTWFKDQR
jgi:pyrroline-5-carboxylate reductase